MNGDGDVKPDPNPRRRMVRATLLDNHPQHHDATTARRHLEKAIAGAHGGDEETLEALRSALRALNIQQQAPRTHPNTPSLDVKEFIARTNAFKSKKPKIENFSDIPAFLLEVGVLFPETKDLSGSTHDKYLKVAILDRLCPWISKQIHMLSLSKDVIFALTSVYRATIPTSDMSVPLLLRDRLCKILLASPYGAQEALVYFETAMNLLIQLYGLTLDNSPAEWNHCLANFQRDCMDQLGQRIKDQNRDYYGSEEFQSINALQDCKKWIITLQNILYRRETPTTVSFANLSAEQVSFGHTATQTAVKESTSKTKKSSSKPKSQKSYERISDKELRKPCTERGHNGNHPRYLCFQRLRREVDNVLDGPHPEFYEGFRLLSFQLQNMQKELNLLKPQLAKLRTGAKSTSKGNQSRETSTPAKAGNANIDQRSPLEGRDTERVPSDSSRPLVRPPNLHGIFCGSEGHVTSIFDTTLFGGMVQITEIGAPENVIIATASGDQFRPCAIGQLTFGDATIGPIFIMPQAAATLLSIIQLHCAGFRAMHEPWSGMLFPDGKHAIRVEPDVRQGITLLRLNAPVEELDPDTIQSQPYVAFKELLEAPNLHDAEVSGVIHCLTTLTSRRIRGAE